MSMPVYPPLMKKGDKAAVVAPASPASDAELRAAVRSLEYLGLRPVIMPSCDMRHGYLSGSDENRAADINYAFYAKDIKGIFCLRGGYGSARLLPLIDRENVRRRPKVFVGYSDITALHTFLAQQCGLVTFHGPMPSAGYESLDTFSLRSLVSRIFRGPDENIMINNPDGRPLYALYRGSASGRLIGGNLSVLVSTLGTPYEINTDDSVLFIEDVNEQPYRIDRALTSLALAGKFRGCACVILGTFAGCACYDRGVSKGADDLSITDMFREIILPYRKPAFLNLRAGHVYPQITLPMGAEVSVSENGDILLI